VREISPDDARERDAAVKAGDDLYQTKAFDKALATYERALFADPDNAGLWRKVGLCQTRMSKIALALQALEHSSSLAPEDPMIANTLSIVLLKAGKKERSLEAARRAVRLKKDDADLWDTLGQSLDAVGSKRGAHEAFRRALKLDPQHPGAKEALKRVGE
jgi:Flp pilus assembly protein TadD